MLRAINVFLQIPLPRTKETRYKAGQFRVQNDGDQILFRSKSGITFILPFVNEKINALRESLHRRGSREEFRVTEFRVICSFEKKKKKRRDACVHKSLFFRFKVSKNVEISIERNACYFNDVRIGLKSEEWK